MSRSRALALTALGLAVLTLAACAPGGNTVAGTGTADVGFFYGLWHGFISPITFIVSLFSADVGIYEIRNTGGWYDFGFLLGVSAAFGGGAGGAYAGRRR